ncbi:MAG: AI-2E family transporter [Methylococcaceae bacterium]|nr:AI-2E family transporter [Methylococcaceae bacterium]
MNTLPRSLPLLVFLAGLSLLVYQVLGNLLKSIIWAIIMVYATWPLFYRMKAGLGGRSGLAACLMVLLLGIAIIAPLIGMTTVIQREAVEFIHNLPGWLEQRSVLHESLARIPLIGEELSRVVEQWGDIGEVMKQQIIPQIRALSRRLVNMLGGAGLVAGQWILTLFLMFFLYRDGETLTAELRHGLRLGLGERADNYVDIAVRTSRAVLYGIVLTAIVQGSVAGIGYWGVKMPAPALLTLTTIAMALIPFGSLVVWVLCVLWLFLQGETWRAMALLLWGSLVVSWVDNIVRPLVISQATRIPFALVVLGIVGGLVSYGFLGLFIGPVVLAIAHAAWREWLKTRQAPP